MAKAGNNQTNISNSDLYLPDYLKSIQAKFISDEPVSDDLISGKPFENVAQRIAKYISESDPNKDPRTIALLGDWGSGKSSIIEMLRTKLQNKEGDKGRWRPRIIKKLLEGLISSDVYDPVFIFDAWEHEGDSLRLSFLMSYKEHLKKNRLNSGKRQCDKAITKFRETASYEEMSFSFVAIFIVIIAFILIVIVNHIFAFIPISLEMSALLISSVTTFATLLLMQNRKHQEIMHSSLDFENSMINIIKEQSGKRSVFVIDNLDRLGPENARKCWATLQGLTAQGKKSNFFVIVPIRVDTARDLFDNREYGLTEQKEQKAAKAEACDCNGYGSQFFSKLFPVVFRTPKLITSNCRQLLQAYLNQAFKVTDSAYDQRLARDFEIVTSIYGRMLREGKASTSPREIKHFVNRLVGLTIEREEWQLSIKAFYLFCETDIRKNPTSFFIQKNDELQSLYCQAYQIGWIPEQHYQTAVASLHYNIDKNSAVDIQFKALMGEAFRRNLPTYLHIAEQIDKVSHATLGRYKDYFEDFFMSKPTMGVVCKSVTLLHDYSRLYIGEQEKAQINNLIRANMKSVNDWSDINAKYCRALNGVFYTGNGPIQVENYLSSTPFVRFSNAESQASEWVEAFIEVGKAMCQINDDGEIVPTAFCQFEFPNVNDYLAVLDEVFAFMCEKDKTINSKVLDALKYKGDTSKIVGEIIDVAEKDPERFVRLAFAYKLVGNKADTNTWAVIAQKMMYDTEIIKESDEYNVPRMRCDVEKRSVDLRKWLIIGSFARQIGMQEYSDGALDFLGSPHYARIIQIALEQRNDDLAVDFIAALLPYRSFTTQNDCYAYLKGKINPGFRIDRIFRKKYDSFWKVAVMSKIERDSKYYVEQCVYSWINQ